MSGAIHSIGADITSVDRCLVTPRSSADGTNDQAIHRHRSDHVTSSGASGSVTGSIAITAPVRHRSPHRALKTTRAR